MQRRLGLRLFCFGGEERDRRGSIKIHPNCKGR